MECAGHLVHLAGHPGIGQPPGVGHVLVVEEIQGPHADPGGPADRDRRVGGTAIDGIRTAEIRPQPIRLLAAFHNRDPGRTSRAGSTVRSSSIGYDSTCFTGVTSRGRPGQSQRGGQSAARARPHRWRSGPHPRRAGAASQVRTHCRSSTAAGYGCWGQPVAYGGHHAPQTFDVTPAWGVVLLRAADQVPAAVDPQQCRGVAARPWSVQYKAPPHRREGSAPRRPRFARRGMGIASSTGRTTGERPGG